MNKNASFFSNGNSDNSDITDDVLQDNDDFEEHDILEEDNDVLEDDVFEDDDNSDIEFLDDELNADDSLSGKAFTDEEAEKIFDKKQRSNKMGNVIRWIIIVIAAVVFFYSAYMLINIFSNYKKADNIYNNIDTDVLIDEPETAEISGIDDNEPTVQEVEIPFRYNHQSLLNINSDGVGYFYMPSIDKRYPIVQTLDNDYYLNHTFNKEESSNGCLFEDCNINGGIDSSHVIIYGHNMKNGSMFGMLNRYKSSSFYNSPGNDVFYIYTRDVIRQYKIFSVYICDPVSDAYVYNFSNQALLQKYAQGRKSVSLYDTGVDISQATQIVTLSTCTNNGEQRLLVHGVFVGEGKITN